MISATFLLKHVSSGQREGTKPTAHVVGHLALISQEDLPNSGALEELKIEQHQCESVITWQGGYCSWSTWDLGVALLAALWDGKALFNPTQIFTQCTTTDYVTWRSTMSSRVQKDDKMKNYRENQ